MRFLINTTKILILLTSVLLIFSCTKEGAKIPEKTMSKIIADMYITDQYIESSDKLKFGIDSVSVYTPIIKKYGYTVEDYHRSTSFYLAKGNSYKKIYTKARDILKERKLELDQIVAAQKEELKYIEWPLLDTIYKIRIDKLYKYPYLRMVRWFILKDKNIIFNLTDTSEIDLPQNIKWWQNNLRLNNDTLLFNNINPYYKTDFYRNNNSKSNSDISKNIKVDITNVNVPQKSKI